MHSTADWVLMVIFGYFDESFFVHHAGYMMIIAINNRTAIEKPFT